MILGLDCARPSTEISTNKSFFQVCNEHEEHKMMLQSFFLPTMFIPQTRGTQNVFIGQFPLKAHHFPRKEYILFIYLEFFFVFGCPKKGTKWHKWQERYILWTNILFSKNRACEKIFFRMIQLGALGVILTMQLEPPKRLDLQVVLLFLYLSCWLSFRTFNFFHTILSKPWVFEPSSVETNRLFMIICLFS